MINQFSNQSFVDQARHGLSQVELFEENERAVIDVLTRDGRGFISSAPPVESFDNLLLMRVDERDVERTQVALSHVPKLYAFFPEARIYSFAATIIDTSINNQLIRPDGRVWTGRGFLEWRNFFDQYASAKACVQTNRVVRIVYARTVLYGAILEYQAQQSAEKPHQSDITFLFFVTARQQVANAPETEEFEPLEDQPIGILKDIIIPAVVGIPTP